MWYELNLLSKGFINLVHLQTSKCVFKYDSSISVIKCGQFFNMLNILNYLKAKGYLKRFYGNLLWTPFISRFTALNTRTTLQIKYRSLHMVQVFKYPIILVFLGYNCNAVTKWKM